jgi:hypothetical protein
MFSIHLELHNLHNTIFYIFRFKRRVVVRRVVAMSPCRLAYKPILRIEPSVNVTSRQPAHDNALFSVHC